MIAPELEDRNMMAPFEELDEPDDDCLRLALVSRSEPGPDKTPNADRPFIDITCIASRTEAVPGSEMSG